MAALGQFQVILLVASTVIDRFATRLQSLHCELADRLEHPEARLGRIADRPHQALIDEVGDQLDRVEAPVRVRHLLDGLKLGAADEDGQPGEEDRESGGSNEWLQAMVSRSVR